MTLSPQQQLDFENKSIVTGAGLKSNHLSRLRRFPDPDQSKSAQFALE